MHLQAKQVRLRVPKGANTYPKRSGAAFSTNSRPPQRRDPSGGRFGQIQLVSGQSTSRPESSEK
eukprot:3795295-Alexandrium_andersonii.AAC.1